MNKISCECAQRLRPVETVENLCGQATKKTSDAMSLNLKPKYKSFTGSNTTREDTADLLAAVIDAIDVLNARIDALETKLDSLIAIRQLKDELP